MKTPNFTDENIAKIAEIFPNCLTETHDEKGNLTKAIDFDLLRQELSANIVDGQRERYQINWPGKREALIKANEPINKTLRPSREESVNFDTTQNLYIEGDNLEALKLLQESYLGKVKMIYIDPPYNTGKDFVYNDKFVVESEEYNLLSGQKDEEGGKLVANPESNGRFHSDWLSMIYPRLKLARNLLKDDGVIFISIDDNEVHALKKLCDEVFGEDNFITELIWDKQHSQQQGLFKKYHEYVVCYAKNINSHQNISGGEGIIDAGAIKKISKANPASLFTFPAGTKVIAPDGTKFTGTYGDSEKLTIEEGEFIVQNEQLLNRVTISAGWTQKNQMDTWFKGIETFDTKGQKIIEFYFNSTGKLKCKKERTKITPPTLLPKFGMASEQTEKLKNLMGGTFFDNPKPIDMLKLFASWFSDDTDLVLDFFSGSASTAHALLELNAEDGGNRKYIMVQLTEETDEKSEAYKAGYKTIPEIGKERIRRAGKKILEENKDKEGIQNLDIGFRVLKVDSSNMKDVYYTPDQLSKDSLFDTVENIKEDRTAEDLLFQVLLDWGVDLMLPIVREEILGKTVFFVDGDTLAACFDDGIDEAFVKELAKREVMRVVFKDSGFKEDDTKGNVDQIFAQLSPDTEVRAI